MTDIDSSLATLLHLSKRARHAATAAELRFLLVNETNALFSYKQAAYFSHIRGVEVLSGVGVVEQQAPYVQWLKKWFKNNRQPKLMSFAVNLNSLGSSHTDWKEWLPPHLLTVYIPAEKRYQGGALMLARETPFSEGEVALIEEWVDAWRSEYERKVPLSFKEKLGFKAASSNRQKWVVRTFLLACFVAVSLVPVKLSVLAPAELIPLNPLIVRAPIDGVVDRILIEPNDKVEVGSALFEFDSDALKNRLDVAKKALATAEAEYRQRAQQALFDSESKAQLAIAKSRIEEKQIDVNYLLALNERAVVTSSHEGVALIDDPSQWSGRPVVTGERVLVVADQNEVIVEGWLAISDRLQFELGSKVTLYLAADPITPISAQLTYVANQPEIQPDGNFGYRVRAQIDQQTSSARVGLKGTMRVDGERVSLIYWVLRRPWASLRGWLGV